MSDHDHGPFMAEQFRQAAKQRAKDDAELDAWLAEPLELHRYKSPFWVRHRYIIGCCIGCPSGVVIALVIKWLIS